MTDPASGMTSWAPPQQQGYPYSPVKPTNGMAVAAMVTSIVGLASVCFYGVGGIVLGPIGAILGHIARRQIKERDQQGEGLALAGIVIGWIATALGVLVVAAVVIFVVWAVNLPDIPNQD